MEIAPSLQESFSSLLIEMGAGGTWIDGAKVKAYFDPSTSTSEEISEKLSSFCDRFQEVGIQIPHHLVDIQKKIQKDWNQEWKKFFKPVQISRRLTVSPPWEECEVSSQEERVIWIEPGLGFGTGTHPTTRNCLVILDQILSRISDPARCKVLDLGSGSGILAIAAAKLGAGEILAAETDGDALESMRHNLMINKVAGQVKLRLGSIFQADRNSYHLVMANITAEDLIRVSRDLAGAIQPGGNAILSGILVDKKAAVDSTFSNLNLRKLNEMIENNWVTQIWVKAERN
ncbi:MAG: 50S ribosomal protein L11 methyltransferase [Nitrospirae bacterium]|nr:50S ribosomal protein L11 methyltransferase [Nitrospirota bacterium]